MGGNFKTARNRIQAPVQRLEKSHRKLEVHLDELAAAVAGVAASKGKSEVHWDKIDELVAYFQRSVLRHEQDEEDSVFPRLAEHPALRSLITRLTGDHQSQRKLVAALAELCASPSRSTAAAIARLGRISKEFKTSLLDHIAREDRELLPALSRHVSASEQAAIAIEMADRRG